MASLLSRLKARQGSQNRPESTPVASPAVEPSELIRIDPAANVPASVDAGDVPLPTATPNPEFESVETIEKLETTGRTGDFVLNSQETDERFRNVSAAWTAKCITFDQARERIARDKGATTDLVVPFKRLQPVVNGDGFALMDRETQTTYQPSPNALQQLCRMADVPASYPRKLLDRSDVDNRDHETLLAVMENGLRHYDGDKDRLIRLRNDGTIRAILSDRYAIIDHSWFLDVLESIIPDGLVSHFRGDGDSVFFNVLIPDSLRAEQDSEYGGMLACGNSEIGVRTMASLPSVFRAICMNGCIWDRVDGVAFVKKRHLGDVNLAELAQQIRENLNRQIPLLDNGIDAMLRLRSIVADRLDVRNAIAGTLGLIDGQVTRSQASAIVDAYKLERTDDKLSAFDLLQSFTRAAQTFGPQDQENVERVAGQVMLWNSDRWERAFADGSKLKAAELQRVFTKSVL